MVDADRYKALQDKVDHLLKIRFTRKSYYPDWLANPVLGIKPNGKWRMHIDFTNLKKACPQRQLILASNKLANRCDSGTRAIKLYGRILQIQSDSDVRTR